MTKISTDINCGHVLFDNPFVILSDFKCNPYEQIQCCLEKIPGYF